MKNIFILLFTVLLSCSPKGNEIKSIDYPQEYQISGEKEELRKVIEFFQAFQILMKKQDRKAIASKTNFPLKGDCIYYFVFGEKALEKDFEMDQHKIVQKDFINNFERIFNKQSNYLISKVDFEKLILDDQYEFKEEIDENSYYQINFYKNENVYNLSISYNNLLESTSESSTIYQFKLIDNQIKLYSIFCAG